MSSKEKILNGEDEAFNKYIEEWNDDIQSGRAKRAYNEFISKQWNPIIKKINENKKEIKKLLALKERKIYVSENDLKSLQRDTRKLVSDKQRIEADKQELTDRLTEPDFDNIFENYDWA